MNRSTIILIFLLTFNIVKGQTYNGTSLDKTRSYKCTLKINSDSSILFIYHTKENEIYGEHFGKINRINDTIYHVSATMTLGKFDNMRLHLIDTLTNRLNDTDYVCIDTKFNGILWPLKIKYTNGKIYNYNYSKSNCMALDKNLFNKAKGFNYYMIISNAIDKLNGDKLFFKVSFGSAPSFESGQIIDFKIVVKDDSIYSMDAFSLQTGQFRLKRNGT